MHASFGFPPQISLSGTITTITEQIAKKIFAYYSREESTDVVITLVHTWWLVFSKLYHSLPLISPAPSLSLSLSWLNGPRPGPAGAGPLLSSWCQSLSSGGTEIVRRQLMSERRD